RAHWDHLLIRRGLAALERALKLGGEPGPYTLQAAIAACHGRARTAEETDWRRIAELYDTLARQRPTPVVELNRGMAHAMAFGPAAAQDPTCVASASWVNSPQMQLSVPQPEPFCAFHQFAWQNFLALIQNNGYLSFMPSINVFVATGTPMPWTNKPNPLSLGQIHKEAGDEDPLIAQSGQMTQFDIRMNRSFYNYIVKNQLWNTKGFNA